MFFRRSVNSKHVHFKLGIGFEADGPDDLDWQPSQYPDAFVACCIFLVLAPPTDPPSADPRTQIQKDFRSKDMSYMRKSQAKG